MTSILTNTGAMVALQTLKGVNRDLGQVQEQISTGKKVGTAKDNAAVWAISKTMEADVTGFKKISEGLNVGKSTVAVARDASETVTDLLNQMYDKVTQAQNDGLDASARQKIQDDITSLTSTIEGVISSAQFNGKNLVDGTANDPMQVLSSIDRAADGSVTASNIDVSTLNLTTNSGVNVDAAIGDDATAIAAAGGVMSIASPAFLAADGTATTGTVALARSEFTGDPYAAATSGGVMAGDVVTMQFGNAAAGNIEGVDYLESSYTVKAGDTAADVMRGMAETLNNRLEGATRFQSEATGTVANTDINVRVNETTGALEIVNNHAGTAVDADFATTISRGEGALSQLNDIDVTDIANAKLAITAVEDMLQVSIDAAAKFGTAQNQIETQSEFVSKLTDNLKAGIGSMVDADMEETSARLQALQTQQQLGIQSLSIANQAPSSVMALFR